MRALSVPEIRPAETGRRDEGEVAGMSPAGPAGIGSTLGGGAGSAQGSPTITYRRRRSA